MRKRLRRWLPLLVGVAIGLLAARPSWEYRALSSGPIALYVSGQPSFRSDDHVCRVSPDGWIRVEPRR